MKDLPYFLLLIKKNTILWSIITTNSFTNIDFKNTVHGFWTNQCLELKDYSLNQDEKFTSVIITITDICTIISFNSNSSKYLDNTMYYFNRDVTLIHQSPYTISNVKVNNTN